MIFVKFIIDEKFIAARAAETEKFMTADEDGEAGLRRRYHRVVFQHVFCAARAEGRDKQISLLSSNG
jgi:hypothetical protein